MGKNFLSHLPLEWTFVRALRSSPPVHFHSLFCKLIPPLGERAFWMIPVLLFDGSVCSLQTLTGMLILLRPCWGSQYFRLRMKVQWSSWIPFSLAIHPSYYYNLQILNLKCLHSNLKQSNNLTHKMENGITFSIDGESKWICGDLKKGVPNMHSLSLN